MPPTSTVNGTAPSMASPRPPACMRISWRCPVPRGAYLHVKGRSYLYGNWVRAVSPGSAATAARGELRIFSYAKAKRPFPVAGGAVPFLRRVLPVLCPVQQGEPQQVWLSRAATVGGLDAIQGEGQREPFLQLCRDGLWEG